MVTDKEAAHKLVMRHITSGTLFSTGMRFYQVRDSLQAGNAITLQKVTNGTLRFFGFFFQSELDAGQVTNADRMGFTYSRILFESLTGKIKVNESQMTSSNIPATNGVIHVIDSLL